MRHIPQYWLYLPVIVFAIFLVAVLVEKSSIVDDFPVHKNNDLTSYMAKLHFLDKYGYHESIPNWYNGNYTLFLFYPPMWFFLAYPLLVFSNNVQLVAMISFVITYLLGLLVSFMIGKDSKFTKLESLAFFLLVFANPFAVSNLIRLGRPHELLAWVLLLFVVNIALNYRNKPIDSKFFLVIIPYSMILLTHQPVFVIGSFALASLLVTKPNIERLKVILAGIITLAITSFWWVPFLLNIKESGLFAARHFFSARLLSLDPQYYIENITSFVVAAGFLFVFFLYWKTHKEEKPYLFFLPQLLIGLLFFTRLIPFIPILKSVYPDAYSMFLLIYTAYFLFKIRYHLLKPFMKWLIFAGLILLTIVSSIVFLKVMPPIPGYTQEDLQTFRILEEVDGKFLIFNSNSAETSFYSYAAIYLNLSTPSGWAEAAVNPAYVERLNKLPVIFNEEDCENLSSELEFFNTTNLITYGDSCGILKECNFRGKAVDGITCLYATR